jgi:hypothetical protein
LDERYASRAEHELIWGNADRLIVQVGNHRATARRWFTHEDKLARRGPVDDHEWIVGRWAHR